jgi:hypothetical protein
MAAIGTARTCAQGWKPRDWDLLALFRAPNRMHLTPQQIPQRLIRQLFEIRRRLRGSPLGLDQLPGKLDLHAMLRDTLAALGQLPAACSRLRKNLPPQSHHPLSQLERTIRTNLNPTEAYNLVPGRDPNTIKHP